MDFFVYNNKEHQLEFNVHMFLTIREFAALYDIERNKCKDDKTGKDRSLARREFIYMWLKMNKKSPYSQYTEQEAHQEALRDSRLTESEFNDPLFREACRKYIELRDSNKISKLLRAAYNKIDDITDYLENILDLSEKDMNGKPVYKVKDVIDEINRLGGVIEGIKRLEQIYDREEEAANNLRADAVAGHFD